MSRWPRTSSNKRATRRERPTSERAAKQRDLGCHSLAPRLARAPLISTSRHATPLVSTRSPIHTSDSRTPQPDYHRVIISHQTGSNLAHGLPDRRATSTSSAPSSPPSAASSMADTTRKTPGFLFRKSRALSEPLFLRSLCDGSCTQKPATFVCPFPHSEVERKQWQMEIDEDWESYQSQRYEEAKRNGEHYAPAAREHRGSGRDGRDARDDREHRDHREHREHRDGHDSRHNGTKGSASSTRPTPSRSPSSSSSSGASGGTSPATYRPPRSRTQPSSQQQQQPHEYDRSSSRSSSSRSEHSSASVVSGSSAVDELLSNHDGSQLEARTTDSRKGSEPRTLLPDITPPRY